MGFDDLIKKGQELAAGKDGKVDYKAYQEDAQDAYTELSKTDGSFVDRAKNAYTEVQKNHAGSSDLTSEEKK